MNDLYIVFGAIGVGWLVFLFLRAPSIVLFLSLLSGQILASQSYIQVYGWIEPFLKINDIKYLQLGLFLLPVILTLLIMRNKISKSKLSIEIVPYGFIAVMLVLLAEDYSWILQQKMIMIERDYGSYKALILIVATLSTLVSAWINYPNTNKKKKH